MEDKNEEESENDDDDEKNNAKYIDSEIYKKCKYISKTIKLNDKD